MEKRNLLQNIAEILDDALLWLPEPLRNDIENKPPGEWRFAQDISFFVGVITLIKEADLKRAILKIESVYDLSSFKGELFLLRARIEFLDSDYPEMLRCLECAENLGAEAALVIATLNELTSLLRSETLSHYDESTDLSKQVECNKGSCVKLAEVDFDDVSSKANVSSKDCRSSRPASEIPRKLHFVWVGDSSRCPNNLINTWSDKNPDCSVKVWGNAELFDRNWITKSLMHNLFDQGIYCGVADLMRYEILLNEGGVAIDADSECLRSLPEFIFHSEVFAAWESEIARPGLIANGTMGAVAGSRFLVHILEEIVNDKNIEGKQAWQIFGPGRLTHTYRKYEYHNLTIHPSHYFTPEHFTGVVYSGSGAVFAHQFWSTTKSGS